MSCNWEPWINPLLLLHYWKNLSNLGENVWIANDGVGRVFSMKVLRHTVIIIFKNCSMNIKLF